MLNVLKLLIIIERVILNNKQQHSVKKQKKKNNSTTVEHATLITDAIHLPAKTTGNMNDIF